MQRLCVRSSIHLSILSLLDPRHRQQSLPSRTQVSVVRVHLGASKAIFKSKFPPESANSLRRLQRVPETGNPGRRAQLTSSDPLPTWGGWWIRLQTGCLLPEGRILSCLNPSKTQTVSSVCHGKSMERSSRHRKCQVWITCFNIWIWSVVSNGTKVCYCSSLCHLTECEYCPRSMFTIMCLWPSLFRFWLYCVVSKIQIIKTPIILISSHSLLPASQTHYWLMAHYGRPFVSLPLPVLKSLVSKMRKRGTRSKECGDAGAFTRTIFIHPTRGR